MSLSRDAQLFLDALSSTYPRRAQFGIEHLLEAFRRAFPHRQGDTDARSTMSQLLVQLEQSGVLHLPKKTNRRAYDYSERTPLPKHVTRCDRLQPAKSPAVVWRPELAFAGELGVSWHEELLAVQEWLRNGGTAASPIALRERSVEIFRDEKRLDSLLGTQLFTTGRLTLDLLRCYLPSIPIYVVTLSPDGLKRPLLVVENHTTFDTLCRWNAQRRQYAAVAFGAGAAFIAASESLRVHLVAPGCSGQILYFGDLDPKGLWIPARASQESGIETQPDETLYSLLLAKGRKHRTPSNEPFSFEPGLLNWLPAPLREETGLHFKKGRRLPQELVSLPDLL